MEIVLLYASPYRMVDEKTGEVTNEGISAFAYGTTNFKPSLRERNGNVMYGRRPLKLNIPMDMMEKITNVPGVYDVDIEMEGSGKDLKAQLTVYDIECIGQIETKVLPIKPEK